MSDIIRLHHEDWDFDKLFGDLKVQGVKSARLMLPKEWEDDEKLKLEKTTDLLKASETAGVNILELVPHKRDSSPQPKAAIPNDGLANKFGPAPIISNSHLKLYLIIGSILAAMVVTGAVVLSQQAFKRQEQQLTSPKATIPTSTPTPSPTPTPVINRKDLTVRVLNGSGKRGAAAELSEFLEKLGYSVSLTGNTNLQEGSKLRLKPTGEVYRKILTADLESKLEPASGSALPQADVVGAEIIIGTD